MADIILSTAPNYATLTATASLATSTYQLTQMEDGSGKASMNISPNIYDVDLTLGNMVIKLFAISELFASGSAGLGFTMKGTIVATTGGARTLVIKAYTSIDETNTICGVASATITGSLGDCFILTPDGLTNWILISCASTTSPPAPPIT